MANTSFYYENKFPVVTGNASFVNDFLVGAGANVLISSLSEVLKVGRKSTKLNFLIKNAAGEAVVQAVDVIFDPATEQFKVDGKAIVNVAGGVATDALVAGVLSALGVGASIVGVTGVVVGLAPFFIWTALSELTSTDEAIANFIDKVIRNARGAVPLDLQILDANGNVLGGAFFQESINQAAEFDAIKMLLAWIKRGGIDGTFPDVVVGVNKIRAVEQTRFSPQKRVYELYDGALIDVVSQALGITSESLLSLGKESNPNNNKQIYFYDQTSSESLIFTQEKNRLFIPLPTKTDGESTKGLHPSNILISSENKNVLDAYLANRPSSPFFNQDALLIGTGVSNDSLKGSGGNDVLIGGKGNDEIDGRQGGEDIAIFSDNYKNYDISFSTNGNVTITHLRGTKTDGTDTLTNVEFAKFKDGTLSLTDSLQNRPSQLFGNYKIQQVSTDDVVDGPSVPIISGSQVYWQVNAESSLYDDKTVRFDTNTGLLSEITSSSAKSSYQLAVNEDKILLTVNYKDRSPRKLELYTGESLVQVGNVSDFNENKAIIFGDNVLLETRSFPRQLVAYNYKNGATTLLAENNSNSPTLPDFTGLWAVAVSGNKIAWISPGGNIFLYDGNTTIQIPKIYEFDGVYTYNISNVFDIRKLHLDEKNLFWTNGEDLFLYNGVETRKIAELATSQTPIDYINNGFKFSGNRVVWTTREVIKNTPTIDTVLHSLYLYDDKGVRTIYKVEKTTELATAGIRNLTISGENIVWTETDRAVNSAIVQDLYLYDIGNSNAQPKLLSNDVDTLFSFKLFGEQVAWTAPNNVRQSQLYAYDGNSVWQLTNLAPHSRNYIMEFGVSEKGVVWVANDDGENRDKIKPEIFAATLIQKDNYFNIITGNSSNSRDPLTGTAANDRITGGPGAKTITGGAGNDEFVYTNLKDAGQRIADFTVGEDKIVLTQLLSSIGYQGTNAINDGYVRLVEGSIANSSILQIDRDGLTGSAIFRPFLQLDNVTLTQINSVDNFVF